MHTPVVAIMGPTASGKSNLGIEIALRFNGEIINCDSVQVYREIEIATAKLLPSEQRGVPHHLLDFVPPGVRYSAGQWARDASVAIAEIKSRARLPIIVGGTGLYLRALREPFFESPPTNEALRLRFNAIRARRGAAHLHQMLRRLDSEAARRIHKADWSRTTRALEHRMQTGRTLSDAKQVNADNRITDAALNGAGAVLRNASLAMRIFALDPPRPALYERINRRSAEHFRIGLVEEVRALLARGVPPDSNALGAHGYRRVVEHLKGERTLESAITQTQIDVRHYAKRQWTWFRREQAVEWVAGFGDDSAIVEQVIRKLEEAELMK